MLNKALFTSTSPDWPTPKALYDQLNAEFRFDYDPCPLDGAEEASVTLPIPWFGRRVFCNPPYGPGIGRWLERSAEADVAVYLLPARTDTRWFHEQVLNVAREIRFVRGRLKFGDSKDSAPFPSIIVIFGN